MKKTEILISLEDIYNRLKYEGVFNNEFLMSLEQDIMEDKITSASLRIEMWLYGLIESIFSDVLNQSLLGKLKKGKQSEPTFLARKLGSSPFFSDIAWLSNKSMDEYVVDKDHYLGYRKTTQKASNNPKDKRRIIVENGVPAIRNAYDKLIDDLEANDVFYEVAYEINKHHSEYTLWIVSSTKIPRQVMVYAQGDIRILEWNDTFIKKGKYVGEYFQ